MVGHNGLVTNVIMCGWLVQLTPPPTGPCRLLLVPDLSLDDGAVRCIIQYAHRSNTFISCKTVLICTSKTIGGKTTAAIWQ